MSLTEKLAKLETATAGLRHVVRHNGGAISRNADMTELAGHALDINPDRVATMWQDIGTIDGIKKYFKFAQQMARGTLGLLKFARPMKFPELTTEELLSYGVNDERLVKDEYSWAVVKLTKAGAEILTYGGSFYQSMQTLNYTEALYAGDTALVEDPTVYGLEEGGYYYMLEGVACVAGEVYKLTIESATKKFWPGETEEFAAYDQRAFSGFTADLLTIGENSFVKIVTDDGSAPGDTLSIGLGICLQTFQQTGDTEILRLLLEAMQPAHLSDKWEAAVQGQPVYTEDGATYYQIPCELPGDLSQLVSVRISRSGADALEYSLTDSSCDTSNAGMVELPHGIWLIYDNSALENAPQALLIPKELADGTETGIRFETVEIFYTALAGLERLRLVGDSFGEEYIISTQDDLTEGTWTE